MFQTHTSSVYYDNELSTSKKKKKKKERNDKTPIFHLGVLMMLVPVRFWSILQNITISYVPLSTEQCFKSLNIQQKSFAFGLSVFACF